jgi:hypothetical protein
VLDSIIGNKRNKISLMITEVDRILYLMENKSMALNDINSKIIQNSELTCEYEELENMLDDLKLNN